MPPIIIVKIDGQDLDELMNNCVPQKFHEDQEKLGRLRCDAFSGEYRNGLENYDGRFHYSLNHSYYLAKCNEEPECLFKVEFGEVGEGGKKLKKANLSFGRITNLPAHYGWQYLKAFTEGIMVPQGPFVIISRFQGKGGGKAFQALKTWREIPAQEYEYKVVCNEKSGCITNDGDMFEAFIDT